MKKERNYKLSAISVGLLLLLIAIYSKVYRGSHQFQVSAYLGDIGIVGFLYFCLAVSKLNLKPFHNALIIALISIFVELFQATGIPRAWNLPRPFVFILGNSFDQLDFLCYFVGILLAVFIDILLLKNTKHIN